MAFCSSCGKEIADGVRFCSNCGAAVGDGVQTAPGNDQPAAGGEFIPRQNMNPQTDQTRAYVLPPQPAPEPVGIDRFGKFFWIPVLILTIAGIVSDPPIISILLAVITIGGAIFSLSRKYKFKAVFIICIILSAITLLVGISDAKKRGLFKNVEKTDYSISSDIEETSDKAGNSATVEESDSAAKPQTGGVDPDLKAFLDSYEKFVDEYVDFMKKYMANPTDLSLLGEYTDMLSELSDFETKLNKYDSNNMSTEDAAYYLEVTTRCSQKMLEIL